MTETKEGTQQNVYIYAKMQLSIIIENNDEMHGRENTYQIQLLKSRYIN